MKKLSVFLAFLFDVFAKNKVFMVSAVKPWVDFETKEHKGTAVEVVIVEDGTQYPPSKDGSVVTNLYEKFTVKVPKDVTAPVGSIVEIINGVGTVYGEYRNQLSVKADDVRVVQAQAPSQKGAEKS